MRKTSISTVLIIFIIALSNFAITSEAAISNTVTYDFFTVGDRSVGSHFIGLDTSGHITDFIHHSSCSHMSDRDLTITPSGSYYGIGSGDIYKIDPSNDQIDHVAYSSTILRGLACSYSNVFYATKMPSDKYSTIGMLDIDSGNYTHLSAIGGEATFIGEISFNPIDGLLYGWGHNDSSNMGIYQINPDT